MNTAVPNVVKEVSKRFRFTDASFNSVKICLFAQGLRELDALVNEVGDFDKLLDLHPPCDHRSGPKAYARRNYYFVVWDAVAVAIDMHQLHESFHPNTRNTGRPKVKQDQISVSCSARQPVSAGQELLGKEAGAAAPSTTCLRCSIYQ